MKDIVFAHGMFLTGASWRAWQDFFGARGYRSVAPSWPGREGDPLALKANPPAALESLTLDAVLQVYREAIAACETTPVIIGHSMGGLIAQLLVQEKKVAAAVAIDSAPPKGVLTLAWSFIRSNAAVFTPGVKPINPTLAHWTYAFAQTLSPEAAAEAYAKWVVPESKRLAKDATTDAGKVDFAAERPPLLMIAGELDHIIPAGLNRKNHARYAASPSRTDFHVFPGRTHWICMDEGWQEVAEYIAAWLDQVGA